ncbi:MAG: thioesterase family protein [Pseudomonadota bacterium]
MTEDLPQEGHDGPYAAPCLTPSRQVPPEWIDYNGHMNVAYYTMAVDQAIDVFLEAELGLGESRAARVRQGPYALQSGIRFLDEMLEGEGFFVRIQLIDHDAKRLHIFCELVRERDSVIAATVEQLLMNVDLKERRSALYPAWGQARLAAMLKDHSALGPPDALGAEIGIRRK